MTKIGIIIWRMNPPHVGHVSLIKKSLDENPHTLLFIAIKKERDEDNPFSTSKIKELLGLIFGKEMKEKTLIIDEIDDVPSDKIWVKNISEKIECILNKNLYILSSCSTPSPKGRGLGWGLSEITFYWWDLSQDTAIICVKKYTHFFQKYKVSFEESGRYEKTIRVDGEEIEISWTNLRQALREWKKEIVEKMLDERIYDRI